MKLTLALIAVAVVVLSAMASVSQAKVVAPKTPTPVSSPMAPQTPTVGG